MKSFIVVLLGATAVGKTALSILLAKALHAEIISCDSMLLYQGFDIGTAKPTVDERQGIPHHLLDCLEPGASFNAANFCRLSQEKMREISSRGNLPLLVGGTGLYMKSFLEGYAFNTTKENASYRKYLESIALEKGNSHLHQLLQTVDLKTAERLHKNDTRRIIRALEVARENEQISQEKASTLPIYPSFVIGITRPRKEIYDRIHKRIDQMLSDGLLEEIRRLLASGVPADTQAMQAIGYKELIPYLFGDVSLEDAVQELKKNTRHFAKRQITWFRKMPYIHWYEASQDQDVLLRKIIWDIKHCKESEAFHLA
ncbi:tRNA (adenosine(37)-N6)-dimethylallyltransferase MiaA [Selenomonas sp. TAMA-11512]|uniref:tRNA (adenosine(37)-N6)-dimethylallyltransferase MiaA n=1 Tax=Selenomonas sp. TAMA-11512 TaxID=3095337 RepID=UPI0030CFDC0C